MKNYRDVGLMHVKSIMAGSTPVAVVGKFCEVDIPLRPKPHNCAEHSDLSDHNNAANKTYESRLLEGESRSDESDEEKHGNILNGRTTLDHYLR
ncbi:hypothetical protein TNCV_4951681 [Trichonephila clavipes]|nr:hypothetical protein TNCV_4951681 [Trichonephila clavipes]